MTLWIQNLIVLLAVAGCLAFVGRQAFQTLRGRKSKIGSCCAKGCSASAPPAGKPTERVHFLPVEMLKSTAGKPGTRTPR